MTSKASEVTPLQNEGSGSWKLKPVMVHIAEQWSKENPEWEPFAATFVSDITPPGTVIWFRRK